MEILHSQISATKIDGHVGLCKQTVLGHKLLKLGFWSTGKVQIHAFFANFNFDPQNWREKNIIVNGVFFSINVILPFHFFQRFHIAILFFQTLHDLCVPSTTICVCVFVLCLFVCVCVCVGVGVFVCLFMCVCV